MKILILSASIGSGHTKAAEALASALRSRGGVTVEVIDFMSAEVSKFNQLLKKLYLAALSLIPDLYDRIYRIAGVRRVGPFTRLLWSTLMYLPFATLIVRSKPDVIICTHPFPEAAASLWKFLHVRKSNKFLLAAVLTDYSLHEIWIHNGVDVYFVAIDDMKRELEQHCQRRQKVFACGIPIGLEFSDRSDKRRAVNQILIMGGGLGLGSIEETLRDLDRIDQPLKIVVVAGRNEKLVSRLRSIDFKQSVTILGYVDNIRDLMMQSTLLITKPGALTMTEAFASGLPMILHAPIPGPEAMNAKYAVDHDAARSIGVDENVASIVKALIADSDRLTAMSNAALKISRAAAATNITNHIINLIEVIKYEDHNCD